MQNTHLAYLACAGRKVRVFSEMHTLSKIHTFVASPGRCAIRVYFQKYTPSSKHICGHQKEPGAARNSHEQPGAARSSQQQPGAARSSQETPGGAGSSQEQQGAAKSSEEPPGEAPEQRQGSARQKPHQSEGSASFQTKMSRRCHLSGPAQVDCQHFAIQNVSSLSACS